jgi:hypothetical protein
MEMSGDGPTPWLEVRNWLCTREESFAFFGPKDIEWLEGLIRHARDTSKSLKCTQVHLGLSLTFKKIHFAKEQAQHAWFEDVWKDEEVQEAFWEQASSMKFPGDLIDAANRSRQSDRAYIKWLDPDMDEGMFDRRKNRLLDPEILEYSSSSESGDKEEDDADEEMESSGDAGGSSNGEGSEAESDGSDWESQDSDSSGELEGEGYERMTGDEDSTNDMEHQTPD